MKICIFGGGSIGGLLAVNLEKIGINGTSLFYYNFFFTN